MNLGSLELELTQRCNLNCDYCYLGKHKSTGTMSDDDVLASLDLVAKLGKKPKEGERFHITYYGGEPLLAFDKIVLFTEAAKAMGFQFRYTVVSNGTIDDQDIIDYCRVNKMHVQRSLDGGPSAMALCRGEKTLERYNQATKKWKDYKHSRRMTIIPETAKYLLGSIHYFKKLGFHRGASPLPDYYADWQPEHIKAFKDNLWKLAEEFVADFRKGKPFHCYWFDRDLVRFSSGKQYIPRRGCAAGRSMHCVTWDGYVVVCHRFASEERDSDFCMGHVNEIINGTAKGYGPKFLARLEDANQRIVPARCKDCIGIYGCTEGCHHCNYKCTGDLSEPPPLYCELKREASRIVSFIDNQLREEDPNWWQKVSTKFRKQQPPKA